MHDPDHLLKVLFEVDLGQIVGAAQLLIHRSHHERPLAALFEKIQGLCVVGLAGLEVEETGDDLQAVFYSEVDLAEGFIRI